MQVRKRGRCFPVTRALHARSTVQLRLDSSAHTVADTSPFRRADDFVHQQGFRV